MLGWHCSSFASCLPVRCQQLGRWIKPRSGRRQRGLLRFPCAPRPPSQHSQVGSGHRWFQSPASFHLPGSGWQSPHPFQLTAPGFPPPAPGVPAAVRQCPPQRSVIHVDPYKASRFWRPQPLPFDLAALEIPLLPAMTASVLILSHCCSFSVFPVLQQLFNQFPGGVSLW